MTCDRLSQPPEDPADSVVFVVNDDATQLVALAALVRKAGAEPLAFTTAEDALEAIGNRPPPRLIITDLHMPGIDGWRFCRLLRSPEYSTVNQVPIVVVSAVFAGEEPNQIAADLGAEAFVAAPVDGAHFIGLIQGILRGNEQSLPARLLLVENARSQARRLATVFDTNGYRVQVAHTAKDALDRFAESAYDVAVLEHHLPDSTAAELLDAFRIRQPGCVCLVMTEDPGTQLALDWMKRGAAAYLRKPFDPVYLVELCHRVQRERKLLQIPEVLAARTRELREREASFRALFETIEDPIIVANTAGHMLFANRALHDKLGYTGEEIARMHLLELHPPDCRREAEDIFVAMTRGERFTCPLPLQRKDGGRMPVETRAWFGRWNGQTCIMGICRDLTAEQEAQGRFERLFSHSPVPMALNELASRRFVDINEAFERATGYRRPEVIGKTAAELQLVPAKAKHAAIAQSLQAQGTISGEELTVRHKDGTLIEGLFTGEVFDLQGKAYSLTAMIDITERKRAEREREVVLALLSHLNQIDALPDLLREVTTLLRDWSGCDAVGIRLQDGNDYPYFETAGFPEAFVKQESSLCSAETCGGDGSGSPVLECMCGNVIMGRFDPNLPFFTEYGSFWTNSTSALLASSSEAERQARTRNRCHGEGYESVALIPLRHGKLTMGLLQINDHRPDQFSKDQIALFERLASHLAIGLKQLESEQARQRSEKKYRMLVENQNDLVVHFDLDKRIRFASPNYCATFGKDLKELLGNTFLAMVHSEDTPRVEDSLHSVLSPPYFAEHEERARTVFGWRWFSWSAKAVLGEDGKAESIISVGRDITERKREETIMASRERLLNVAISCSLEDLLRATVDEAEAITGSNIGFYHFVDPEQATVSLQVWSTNTMAHMCKTAGHDTHYSIDQAGVWVDCMRERRPVIHNDYASLPHRRGMPPGHAPVTRELVAPVLRNGLAVAILGVGNKPTDYDEHDAATIHSLADLAWEIVDAKRAELELRESEARLQLITDSAHDAIIMVDDQGKVAFWNPAAEQILGYRREEAVGREIHALLAPERFLALAHKLFPSFIANGQGNAVGKTLELAARHKNGQEISISLSLSAAFLHGQWHAVGIMRDITSSKRMEEALKKSEEEYRTLFREMLDGFALHQILCDGAGKPVDYRFLNVNPAFERMTGLQGKDIIGKTVLELLPDTESHWIETYGQVALTGKPVFFEQYSRQIGKHFEVSAFSPKPGLFACIFADITERKRAEAEQEKLREQLMQSQKMESVGRLAGGVAHDFNNMLHAILGYTELAASQLEPSHSLHAELKEIKHAAERAAELTRQLLAFARKQTAVPRPLSLNSAVGETLGMLRRLVGESIRLVWKPGAGLWTVLADPTQVGMVLTNLCVNARDAIAEEGQITVETRNAVVDEAYRAGHPGAKPGEFVVLSVADDGCGMTKELLERVFDPFFTTKEVGKGTGLGLASVHGIAEQNGGFVQVASEPGRGTVFQIHLPRHHAAPAAAGDDRAPRLPALPRGSETILVAEDEAIILSICRDLLSRLGYRVLAARTPGEAVAICRDHEGPIHLLLTDVVMPEMNGRRLVALARELLPGIPCLYMSGYTADAIAQHGIIEEGLDFLQKPFANRELAEKVREILDRAKQQRS